MENTAITAPAEATLPRTGPPWEHPGPTGPRFIETAKAILLLPTATFSNMKRDGGWGPPLAFGVVGTTIGFAISLLIQIGIMALAPQTSTQQARPLVSLYVFMFLLLLPFILALSLLFWAVVYHACLRLLGGRHRFETTLRVVSYVYGSTSLLQVFPVFGGVIGFVYSVILSVIGFMRMQEVSKPKAIAAVVVPLLIMLFLATAAVLTVLGAHGVAAAGHVAL
ncbi:MAG TPA: YIP1 family protein [Vicinamibacterales bacterium]